MDEPEPFRAKRPGRKKRIMPNRAGSTASADEIAKMATRGEDVSKFFTGEYTVVRPIHRVNLDLTQAVDQVRPSKKR